jgi:hypothetical protein
MKGRIERTDDDRESVHRLEQTSEVGTLHGKEFCERLLAVLFIARQNHLLNIGQPIFGEEHVLSTAEADTLSTECAGDLRVARNVRVGTNAEFTAEFIGPTHERTH